MITATKRASAGEWTGVADPKTDTNQESDEIEKTLEVITKKPKKQAKDNDGFKKIKVQEAPPVSLDSADELALLEQEIASAATRKPGTLGRGKSLNKPKPAPVAAAEPEPEPTQRVRNAPVRKPMIQGAQPRTPVVQKPVVVEV